MITIDGNEKLTRAMCAAPKEKLAQINNNNTGRFGPQTFISCNDTMHSNTGI